MASISSTDSIGNTSLRGYGGMASGIDRDSIIEKMTLGTTTKITNQQAKVTKLQWKQEAYRNISDQIIDFGDKYTSFSSTDSLIDPNFFAKNIITVNGRDEATRFVTATGSSDLISNISIKGVKQLATSTVRQSDAHVNENGIETNMDDLYADWRSSLLKGSQLVFEKPGTGGESSTIVRLTLPDGYVDEDGKTQEIDYTTTDLTKLAGQLNKALESAMSIDKKEAKELFEFTVSEDGKQLNLSFKDDAAGYKVYGTAMTALGYDAANSDSGIAATRDAFNAVNESKAANELKNFEEVGISHKTALASMTGAKLTFNYDGSQKEVELINASEVEALQNIFSKEDSEELAKLLKRQAAGENLDADEQDRIATLSANKNEQLEKMAENLQSRLDRAYGKDMVKASFTSDGNLNFTTKNKESTISVVSNDYALLNNLGISYGESNKVNLSGKLSQASLLGSSEMVENFVKDDALDLEINGVKIAGLTKDSSINDIISKINSSQAGVKATYVDATGQFMLVASETGEGRDITLDSSLAKVLFGGEGTEIQKDVNGDVVKDADGNVKVDYNETAGRSEGQDAIIRVSYGNGVDIDIKRASNSFNLEGLNVNVTGTFGGEYVTDDDGNKVWKEDASQTITFTAKADVDAIVDRVKSFFEDFNKLATDINTEITTRPDSSYAPLTDEQKAEMDETSIENWENKAKQGMLYGDSTMQNLSMDMQNVFLKLMNSVGFEKLKEMGITYSDDYNDGGTISFDEGKFRTAVENDSEAVGNIFTGGGGVSKGLIAIVDETFTPYATRYASKNGNGGKGSYGQLIEIAGSTKKPTTLLNNQIYNEIEDIQDLIARLQEQLKTEQDRYISQFTTMETLLNQMNTQSSYLSQLTG